MNPLDIIRLAIQWGPTVKSILDEATSNESIVTKISNVSKPLASVLEEVGTQMFPQAAPALHVAAGAMAAFDPNITKWLQGSLNTLLTPSPHLAVDGIYGPKTRTAVQAAQAKLGLTVDGWAGQVTQAAIQSALAKH